MRFVNGRRTYLPIRCPPTRPVPPFEDHGSSDSRTCGWNFPATIGRRPWIPGWVMLVQSRAAAANRAIESLANRLYREGVSALLGFLAVMVAMWLLVVQFSRRTHSKLAAAAASLTSPPASVHTRDTLEQFP